MVVKHLNNEMIASTGIYIILSNPCISELNKTNKTKLYSRARFLQWLLVEWKLVCKLGIHFKKASGFKWRKRLENSALKNETYAYLNFLK